MELWVEERYGITPWPERRLRARVFRWTLTLWSWDV